MERGPEQLDEGCLLGLREQCPHFCSCGRVSISCLPYPELAFPFRKLLMKTKKLSSETYSFLLINKINDIHL